MKSIYLTVIVILTSTVLSAQIKQIPLNGNPVLREAFKNKPAQVDFRKNAIVQNRADCPDSNPDINYLLPNDTFLIKLDTANNQKYQIIDPAANIGLIEEIPGGIIMRGGNTTAAEEGDIVVLRTITSRDGSVDSMNFVYSFVLKRAGETTVFSEESLLGEEKVSLCADPVISLPGTINCSDIYSCAESYGGKELQTYFFTSNKDGENCYNYHSSRFPGRDTICIVLCDEFTVCDTFLQPFLITGDTIQIPFFEDFSKGGPYPNSERWLEDLAFVNQTMAYNPPSIGSAALEGLDDSGNPYGGGFGTADRLTSKAIDLSDEDINSNVYLSFYYQLKGRGFVPRIQDSLIVEFWTVNSKWEKVAAYAGERFLALDSFPDFQFESIYLGSPDYFHNGFQFRFRNLSQRTGAYGVWNIDYIFFDKNQVQDARTRKDLAVSEAPGSILNRYTAMPIDQFIDNEDKELISEFSLTGFNHFSDTRDVNTLGGYFSENVSGTETDVFNFSNPTPFPSLSFSTYRENIPAAGRSDLENLISSSQMTNQSLEVGFNYEISASAQDAFFEVNDTARSITHLDNYFAYDDGTAERAIEVSGTGTSIAIEYEANKNTVLNAVQINFAQINGDISDQSFDLIVWADDTITRPGTIDPTLIRSFVFPKRPDSLQAFTTYVFKDFNGELSPVDIPAGKFFIGIRQNSPSGSPFAIGYDRNNPNALEYFWWSNSPTWEKYQDLIPFAGALMIRPLTGAATPNETAVNDLKNHADPIELFPNPANNTLNFRMESNKFEDYKIQIFNAIGQNILNDGMKAQLDISVLKSGIYFAKFTNLKTGSIQNHQFVKKNF